MTSRLHRQPGWERRLVSLAEELDGAPYVWGQTDCASIARRAIECITRQRDIVERLGLTAWYDSATGALRVFAQLGGIRPALVQLGLRERPIVSAGQGDIVVLPGEPGHPPEAAGVLVSGKMLVSRESIGVYWAPVAAASIAMRL